MSIKKLFDSVKSANQYSDFQTEKQAYSTVESAHNANALFEKQNTFVPDVDYSNPEKFAFYGSAYLYYKGAYDRISDFYPYDGSLAEQNTFYNKLLPVEKYVFNKKYPRTTGYAIFSAAGWGTTTKTDGYGLPNSLEYITFKGGPNTGSQGSKLSDQSTTDLSNKPNRSNVYDESIYETAGLPTDYGQGTRLSNLKSDFDNGVTVEFWLKTGSLDTSLTEKQVIFDLWNNEASGSGTLDGVPNNSYGRIRLELNSATSKRFTFTVQSGSNKKTSTIGPTAYDTFSDWKHYAISFQNSGSSFVTRLYVNGDLSEVVTTSTTVSEINSKNLMGRLGALITTPSGSAAAAGSGKLSGSIDEFRFWKTRRSSAQIAENYFDRVGGGTNTDINNTTLGVYFKFNEGITTTAAVDSIVLDYSGRISNGVWTGYGSTSRNTGSAIVSASAANSEYEDPIIRTTHPLYTSTRTELLNKGTYHDSANNSSFLSYAPSWVIEAHEDLSNDNLKIISHIVGSYFDHVYLLSKEFPKFKHASYTSASTSPVPFASHLPQSLGLYVPDIFVDANVQERLMNRDDVRLYENDLNETRNLIYQNIYNNLANIYKSKGTENAFKNILRCFNLDDELVQLKVYSDNNIYEIKNNLKQIISTNKSVNFNSQHNMGAVVYQRKDSTNAQSRGYISGSAAHGFGGTTNEKYYGFTSEADIIFPRFFRSKESDINRNFKDVSLFGVVQVKSGSGTVPDTAYKAGTNTSTPRSGSASQLANFQVFAVRDKENSKNVYFKLESSGSANPFPTLTSSLFNNVYDDNRWNLSVRLKPKSVGLTGFVSGSTLGYDLIFRGVNSILGTVRNSFEISSSISATTGSNFLTNHKRIYAGALRNNVTGTVIAQSDVKVSNIKYWTKYLENSNLELHLHDIENSGVSGSYKNISALHTDNNSLELTNKDTLALEWNFDLLTSSNAAGTFTNQDFSSGSSEIRDNYGWLGKITGYQHNGFGNFFKDSSTTVVDTERVNSFKFIDPEEVVSSEMISILNDDDELLGFEQTVPNYVLSAEKSLYSAISQEMLIFFAGVIDFNNLVGEPVNRYRSEYKDLSKLKESFFRRVTDVKEVEKFVNYYKWFDSAISDIFSQLVPASANFIDGVQNIVESHVLERNKYRTPFPTIEGKQPDPEGGVTGFSEKTYPYHVGFTTMAESPRPTNKNLTYWKTRAERTAEEITSGDATVDSQRDTIRKIINAVPTLTASRASIVVSQTDNSTYNYQKFAKRNFSKTQKLNVDLPNATTYKGGTNFSNDKDIDFIKAAVSVGGPVNREGGKFVPQNILLSFVDDFQGITDFKDPLPQPIKKIKRIVPVDYGAKHDDRDGYYHVKSTKAFPFGIISSSLTGGYQTEVQNALGLNLEIVNVHNDVYGPDMEKPLQGPFTEKYVGGNQHRHVDLNTGTDDNNNRPEAWRILLGACDSSKSGAIGLVGADYPMSPNYVAPAGANQPYPHANYPRATFYRDKIAKSPVNIRNIKMTTGSTILGNYAHTYEYVQTVGAFSNPRQFVENQPTLPTNLFQNRATASSQAKSFLDLIPSRDHYTSDPAHFDFVTDYSVSYLTASTNKSVIKSRFSAPGGPETLTPGYMDVRSAEYSAYNAIPFRNLSVIRKSQGPSGTLAIADATAPNAAVGIRVSDIHGEDYGLRSHLARHTARFGRDSLHVRTNPGATYNERPGMHKVHRNNIERCKPNYAIQDVITEQFSNTKALLWDKSNVAGTVGNIAYLGPAVESTNKAKYLFDGAVAEANNGSVQWSWQAWIKFLAPDHDPPGAAAVKYVLQMGYANNNYIYSLWLNPYSKGITFYLNNFNPATSNYNNRQYNGAGLLPATASNSWNHYVLTFSGSHGNLSNSPPAIKLYVNGTVIDLSGIATPSFDYIPTSSTTVANFRSYGSALNAPVSFFGGWKSLTHEFDGYADEVAMWDTELSSVQVSQLYNTGAPTNLTKSTTPASSSLMSWWRMGDNASDSTAGSGSTVNLDDSTAVIKDNVISAEYPAVDMYIVPRQGQALRVGTSSIDFLTGATTSETREVITGYTCDNLYDNFNVKHQIPRSTKQYAWITASLLSDNGLVGFVPAGFQVTASDIANSTATGYVNAYNFVSASEIGSRIAGGHRIISDDNSGTTFIAQVARLNLNIVDDVAESSATLGSSTNTENYVNFANQPDSFLTKQVTAANSGLVFNQLMTKRGGQYGFASWQQNRLGDHPIVVNQRRNNKMQLVIDGAPRTYSLSPVSMRQKIQEVGLQDISGRRYKVKTTHYPEYFDNKEVNDRVVRINALSNITPLQAVIVASYQSPVIKNINYIKYSEKTFPAQRNEFMSHSTERLGYSNDFWTSNRLERNKLGATLFEGPASWPHSHIYGVTGSYYRQNAFGFFVSASVWPLDAQTDFLTRTGPARWTYPRDNADFGPPTNSPNNGWLGTGSAGELQNNWQSYFLEGLEYPRHQPANTKKAFSTDQNRAASAIPGPLYARKHMLGSAQSLVNPNSILNELGRPVGGLDIDGGSRSGRYLSTNIWESASVFTSRQADVFSGEAYWDAPANAGYGKYDEDTKTFSFVSAPSVPAHDTYSKFVDSIKKQSRGKAILPEYRLSRNMPDYISYGTPFIEQKKDHFDIPGTSISSSQTNFYIDYSNSEFLKHFAGVQDDSQLNINEIRLVCSASIKFHPYKGFFPAERTVDLVKQFNDTYSNVYSVKIKRAETNTPTRHVSYTGKSVLSNYPGAIRPVAQAFFAPGILYNSIKSGLAVDYPILFDRFKMMVQSHYSASAYTSSLGAVPQYGPEPPGAVQTQFASIYNDYVIGMRNGPGFLYHSSSFLESTIPSAEALSRNFDTLWDQRVPFEAIIDPDIMANVSFADCEPHPSATINTVATFGAASDNTYNLMAKNFFGGVASFYLADSDYTNLTSETVYKDDFQFQENEVYMARIKLRRSATGSRDYSFDSGSFMKESYTQGGGSAVTPRNYDSTDAANGIISLNQGAYFELPQDPKHAPSFNETFTMYSRPTAFGPPVCGHPGNVSGSVKFALSNGKQKNHNGVPAPILPATPYVCNPYHSAAFGQTLTRDLDHSGTFQIMDSFTGYNWSFTPPYYNGEAWADLVFRPTASVTYDLERILAETKVRYWRVDPGPKLGGYGLTTAGVAGGGGQSVGASGSVMRGASASYGYGLSSGVNRTSLIHDPQLNEQWGFGSRAPYAGSTINNNAMQISASLNLFGVERVFKERVAPAGIQPGMNDDQVIDGTNELVGKKWVIKTRFETPMLNFNDKFGLNPVTSSAGTKTTGSFGGYPAPNGMWHQFGTIPTDDKTGIFMEIIDMPKNWLRNHYDVRTSGSIYNDQTPDYYADLAKEGAVGSLRDLCGFKKVNTSKRIGELKEALTINEAVVAVPYVIESTDQNLSANEDFTNFDGKFFFRLPAPQPGQPMSSGVAKQQEMMSKYIVPPQFDFINYPEQVSPVTMYFFEFSYTFDRDDLSYMWQNLMPRNYDKGFFQTATAQHTLGPDQPLSGQDLLDYPNMRWMVFKVKQKVQADYYDYVENQAGKLQKDIQDDSPLQFNWPYDFCSIVEFIEMDTEALYNNRSTTAGDSTSIAYGGGITSENKLPPSQNDPQNDPQGGQTNSGGGIAGSAATGGSGTATPAASTSGTSRGIAGGTGTGGDY